jgi:hypothetical protein
MMMEYVVCLYAIFNMIYLIIIVKYMFYFGISTIALK